MCEYKYFNWRLYMCRTISISMSDLVLVFFSYYILVQSKSKILGSDWKYNCKKFSRVFFCVIRFTGISSRTCPDLGTPWKHWIMKHSSFCYSNKSRKETTNPFRSIPHHLYKIHSTGRVLYSDPIFFSLSQ